MHAFTHFSYACELANVLEYSKEPDDTRKVQVDSPQKEKQTKHDGCRWTVKELGTRGGVIEYDYF